MEKKRLQDYCKSFDAMHQRVGELERALQGLIAEHKKFQISRDLKEYETILNRKTIDLEECKRQRLTGSNQATLNWSGC